MSEAKELINKYYNEAKPYNYGKIWEAFSGKKYKLLNWFQKSIWRETVKNCAEWGAELYEPSPTGGG